MASKPSTGASQTPAGSENGLVNAYDITRCHDKAAAGEVREAGAFNRSPPTPPAESPKRQYRRFARKPIWCRLTGFLGWQLHCITPCNLFRRGGGEEGAESYERQ